jgi:hypothetical protein
MSKFTQASVERRLKRGAYQYPNPKWVAQYRGPITKGKVKGGLTPALWFACLEVADRYGIDLKRGSDEDYTAFFTQHGEEINHLVSFYLRRDPSLGE